MSDIRRVTRSGRIFGGDASAPASPQGAPTASQVGQGATDFLSLLQNGQFSDGTIICDNREIKVHRAIVSARSAFFRAAFEGQFMEGPTGRVTIATYKFEQIQRTLHYIYGQNFENEDGLTIPECIDLIILGEYFLVDGMVDYSARLLWNRLSPFLMATTKNVKGPAIIYRHPAAIGRHYDPYTDNQSPHEYLCDADFDNQFTAAVKAAYSHNVPLGNAAQRIIADFVWAARGVLLGSATVEKLNKEFPDLGSQVFTVMNKGPQSGFLPKWKPGKTVGLSEEGPSCKGCTGCGRSWRWDRVPTCFDPLSLELRPSRAYCKGCVRREAIDALGWTPWTALE